MRIIYFITALLISGCGILPKYHPPAQDVTSLRVGELPDPWICMNGKMFSLKGDPKGNALIPAGTRITVGSRHSWQGYNVTYSCNPSISFVPQGGVTYFANWEVIDESCGVEIYRVSDVNRIGLDFEPSLGRGECGR